MGNEEGQQEYNAGEGAPVRSNHEVSNREPTQNNGLVAGTN